MEKDIEGFNEVHARCDFSRFFEQPITCIVYQDVKNGNYIVVPYNRVGDRLGAPVYTGTIEEAFQYVNRAFYGTR